MQHAARAGRVILALMVLILAAAATAQAGVDPEKGKDIRRLLKVSGIYEQLDYMKANVLDSYAQALSFTYPDAPKEFWQDFSKVITDKDMDTLVDRVVVVYDKHMDHDVVRKLIKMFETPFWEEWREKMPAISREAGLVGRDWAQEFSQSPVMENRISGLVKKYNLDVPKQNTPKKENSK